MLPARPLLLPVLVLALALPAPSAHARAGAAPQVASVSPRQATPGTALRIAGRGFAPGAQVRFLGRAADRRDDRTVTAGWVTRNAIVVRVPRGAASGWIAVRARTGRLSNVAGPVFVRRGADVAGSGRTVNNTVATAAVAAAIAAGGGTAAVLSGSDAPSTPAPAPSVPIPSVPRLFAADSVWNARVGADAALDPTSPVLVAGLVAEVQREQAAGNGPYINTTQYSTPVYRVPADQPTVRVTIPNPDSPTRRALQSAFEAVPIPEGAVPAAGTDGHMTIWQPSTDRLWEMWRARQEADGWHATWGGAIQDVSKHRGYYGPDAWPGAGSGWGASATSLPVTGGLIKLDELRAGRIDHVVGLTIPSPRAGVYAWPAQRTDGWSTAVDSLPEGARLRLDPDLDLDSLRLPKMTRMIAEAAQRYGLMITDKSGVVAFGAEDPTPTGSNPYWEAGGFFEGKYPHQLLKTFPWASLQVLRMDLRSG